MGELIVFSIVWYELGDAFLPIEALHGDDDAMRFTDLMDQINDLRVMGYELDPGKGYPIGVYTVEPLYQAGIDQDIRVKGDDCRIGMLIDLEEVSGFDVGVDEEDGFGMDLCEIIELLEFFSGTVEVIVDGDTDYFIEHGNSFSESLFIMLKSPFNDKANVLMFAIDMEGEIFSGSLHHSM